MIKNGLGLKTLMIKSNLRLKIIWDGYDKGTQGKKGKFLRNRT